MKACDIMTVVAKKGKATVKYNENGKSNRLVITRSTIGSVIVCTNNSPDLKRIGMSAALLALQSIEPLITEVE